jgi:hypothetical protein
MFRRLPHKLPADPVFPTNLEGLGYHLTKDDQIRQIGSDQKYQFRVNASDRVNDLYKASMNGESQINEQNMS